MVNRLLRWSTRKILSEGESYFIAHKTGVPFQNTDEMIEARSSRKTGAQKEYYCISTVCMCVCLFVCVGGWVGGPQQLRSVFWDHGTITLTTDALDILDSYFALDGHPYCLGSNIV